jgi:glycosyltransferase involved in cell wall biosynthesis
VRHPQKVCWLVHQHRAVYELCGTSYADFEHTERDVALRDRIMALDEQMLGECVALYTISQTVTSRLHTYSGLASTPLYHPPLLAPRLQAGPYGSYVLSVARLERNKRVELTVQAVQHFPTNITLVVVGDGTHRSDVERIAEETGVADRVQFVGAVSDTELVELYRDALALIYVPFDEDYGLVTLEAFLAEKPVITANDSGGTLEFVQDGVNGCVVAAESTEIAAAVARLAADRTLASAMGHNGREIAARISWDDVVERLVSHG